MKLGIMAMPVVSELWRLEQEGHKFEDSLAGMNMFERDRTVV